MTEISYNYANTVKYLREMQAYAVELLKDPRERIQEAARLVRSEVIAVRSELGKTGWFRHGELQNRAFPDSFILNQLQETAYKIFADTRVSDANRLEAIRMYTELVSRQIDKTEAAIATLQPA